MTWGPRTIIIFLWIVKCNSELTLRISVDQKAPYLFLYSFICKGNSNTKVFFFFVNQFFNLKPINNGQQFSSTFLIDNVNCFWGFSCVICIFYASMLASLNWNAKGLPIILIETLFLEKVLGALKWWSCQENF